MYGLTRSWSKLGSALRAVIAGVLVFGFQNYDVVFWGCLIPYGLNVINLATYPTDLDGPRRSGAGREQQNNARSRKPGRCGNSKKQGSCEEVGKDEV